MELRERQREAIDGGEFGPGILSCWNPNWTGGDATGKEVTGARSTLVVAATGFGKTVLFVAVAQLHLGNGGGRVMLLTHRDKLLWQARDAFAELSMECDIEMGEFRADTSQMFARDVVLMTVQTGRSGKGQKRFEKFKPEEFGLLIIDEAHHAVSNEFLQCIDHFKRNPNCKVLGVTATPDRNDEKALRAVFDNVAYAYGLQRAISDGWLCPIQAQMHELENYDLSNVRTRAGDFVMSELENELLKHCAPVAQKIYYDISHKGDELTLHFCAGKKQAQATVDALNGIRPGVAAVLLGDTPEDRRTIIYQSFVPDGDLRIVCAVGVPTEGYDNPYLQNISIDRPTQSRSLLEQIVGRGSRLWPELDLSGDAEDRRERIALSPKPYNKIHDFVGVLGRHKLVTVADILGGNDSLNAEVSKRMRESGKPADVAQLMLKVAREQDELKRVERTKDYHRSTATFRTQMVDPFNLFEVSDTRASRMDGCMRLSEKQIDALKRAGYDPASLSSKQGKEILGGLGKRREQGLATPRQVKYLRDLGVPPEIAVGIPFNNVSGIITSIKGNGYKYHPSMLGV